MGKINLTNITRTSGVAESNRSDKKINEPAQKGKIMLKITKKDYNALKFYGDNTKSAIGYSKERKTLNEVDKETQERLIKSEWIDFDPISTKLHNPDFFVTEKGYVEIRKLESERHEDWKLWVGVASLIVSLIIFAKSQGWW